MRSGGVRRHILRRRRAVTSQSQVLNLITGSHGTQAVYYYTLITIGGNSEGLQKRLSIIWVSESRETGSCCPAIFSQHSCGAALSQPSVGPSDHAGTQIQQDAKDGQGASEKSSSFCCFHIAQKRLTPPAAVGWGSEGDRNKRGAIRARLSDFSHVPAVTSDGSAGNSGSPRSSC